MDEPRPPDVEVDFEHDRGAAGEVRRALRRLFDDDETDDDLEADVMLAATEMTTNAVNHTDGGGAVRAWDPKPDVPLRIEVDDTSNSLPSKRAADVGALGGRGLAIVERLSDAWGAFTTRTGKTVWTEFDRIKRRGRRQSSGTTGSTTSDHVDDDRPSI